MRRICNVYGQARKLRVPSVVTARRDALLQGLVICGHCGNRMTVRYHVRRSHLEPNYVCQRFGVEHAQPICQTAPGAGIDQAVGELRSKWLPRWRWRWRWACNRNCRRELRKRIAFAAPKWSAFVMKPGWPSAVTGRWTRRTAWWPMPWRPIGTKNSERWRRLNKIMNASAQLTEACSARKIALAS